MQKLSHMVLGFILVSFFALISPQVFAHASHGGGGGGGVSNDCSTLFTDALQTHGTAHGQDIVFKCDGKIVNNPDTTLLTKSVTNPSGGSCADTCNTAECTASGTAANTIDAGTFKLMSGNTDITVNNGQNITIGPSNTNYDDIRVKNGGTATFASLSSGEYRIDKLRVDAGGIVYLTAGDYWIKALQLKDDSKLKVSGSGTVRIFVKNGTKIGRRAEVNYNSGVANAAKQLFMYGYNNIRLRDDSKFVGFIYTKKFLDIDKRVQITGAGRGQDIEVGDDSVVTYDSTAKNALDLGFLCPSVSDITHYVLSHASTGIYCFKQRVTVTAYNNSSVYTDYDSIAVLDTGTNRGTWTLVSGNGNFNDSTSDDGKATYDFATSDNGVAVFDLYYTRGNSTVDIEVYEQSNTSVRDNDASGNITFYDYGLVVSENNFNTSNPPEGQIYNAVQTAGIADTLHITAYGQTNPTTGACGIISGYNGSKPLKFWQDYIDPNSGTITEKINGTSIGSTEGGAVSVTLSFSSGEATASALYRDVGKIRINFKDDNSSFPLRGSTSDFVVRPAKFGFNFVDNPAATDHNGPVYRKAGEAFTGIITAQDNDGNTTPNFGNESTLEKPVLHSSTLVLPAGGRNASGNDGAIGNGSNLTKTGAGVFQSTALSFDEVGIIKITSQLASANYMNVGGNTSTESGNVGRFVPDRFELSANTPSLASGYSGLSTFTYMGQIIPYSVAPVLTATAKSVTGNTTENYKGNFFKLTTSTVTQSYASNSTQATFDSAAAESTNPNIVDNSNGTATITYSDGGGFVFQKVNGVDATAFNAEIELSTNVIDSDTVAYASNPYKFGGTAQGTGLTFVGGNLIYQGRIQIFDNAGHEELELALPYQVEYFDGNDYVLNTLDNFTVFNNPANISLTPDPSNLDTTASVTTLVGGKGTITLSPPVGGVKGGVIVTTLLEQIKGNLPYLQHDWEIDGNEDGVFDDNPSALATFGVYEGKKNIIFLEEITD